MENFKACEKEMKTKAFSKEGLASNKMDPKEKAKLETRRWIGDMLDIITTHLDAMEAELESIQVANKKPKKGELDPLQNHLNRHKFHQTKLEIILRLLENDSLEPEQVGILFPSAFFLFCFQNSFLLCVFFRSMIFRMTFNIIWTCTTSPTLWTTRVFTMTWT